MSAQPLRTPAEVAERLGKTENWVKSQARKGLIPHTRIGKSPRFTDEHIDAIIAMGEQAVHAPAERVPAQASPRTPTASTTPTTRSGAPLLTARTPKRGTRTAA